MWPANLGNLANQPGGMSVDQDKRSRSSEALSTLLASLSHMDLTPYISLDRMIMKRNGGYSDVFTGIAAGPWTSQSRQETVYREMKVAVKRLRVNFQVDRDFAKQLTKELHVWSKLQHPNILPLLGFTMDRDYPSVVSEWMDNGTIREYMKEVSDVDAEPLILGIAEGVEYLHRHNIVHSDLKADNVLVGHSGEPLLCDFGISRMVGSSLSLAGSTTGNLKGSVRWMAIELLNTTGDAHHTKETDVWAFGMTVFEILARELPYAHLKIDPQVILAIIRGELPARPGGLDDRLPFLRFAWDVCTVCWYFLPEERITIAQVLSFLRANKDSASARCVIGEETTHPYVSDALDMFLSKERRTVTWATEVTAEVMEFDHPFIE